MGLSFILAEEWNNKKSNQNSSHGKYNTFQHVSSWQEQNDQAKNSTDECCLTIF